MSSLHMPFAVRTGSVETFVLGRSVRLRKGKSRVETARPAPFGPAHRAGWKRNPKRLGGLRSTHLHAATTHRPRRSVSASSPAPPARRPPGLLAGELHPEPSADACPARDDRERRSNLGKPVGFCLAEAFGLVRRDRCCTEWTPRANSGAAAGSGVVVAAAAAAAEAEAAAAAVDGLLVLRRCLARVKIRRGTFSGYRYGPIPH